MKVNMMKVNMMEQISVHSRGCSRVLLYCLSCLVIVCECVQSSVYTFNSASAFSSSYLVEATNVSLEDLGLCSTFGGWGWGVAGKKDCKKKRKKQRKKKRGKIRYCIYLGLERGFSSNLLEYYVSLYCSLFQAISNDAVFLSWNHFWLTRKCCFVHFLGGCFEN